MDCELAREVLSARLDGAPEPPLAAELSAALAEHLAGCPACHAWQEAAHQLTRRVRVTLARPVPDQTERILNAVLADRTTRRQPGQRSPRLARIGLAVAAFAQLVIIIPALVFGNAGIGVPPHASRELGAFNLALAIGFLAASLRPVRARGMLPLVGAAIMALILLSAVDTAAGQTTVLAEVPHLIALVGWLLLYALARIDRHEPDRPDAAGGHPERGWWASLRRRWSTWLPTRPIRPGLSTITASVARRTAVPDRRRAVTERRKAA
jgi:predicted anti-sigma-YlaC factor YlaD